MLYADDAGIIARTSASLGKTMMAIVEKCPSIASVERCPNDFRAEQFHLQL